MRAFIAIDLPKEIKDQLAKIQDDLKIRLPKISWVKPSNLHLTLAFCGHISVEQSNQIKKIISSLAKTIKSFRIKLDNLGVFPNLNQGRIIWIGTNQIPAELEQLLKQLKLKLIDLGLPQEDHQFLLHITLGRIKNRLNPSLLEKTLGEIKDIAAYGNFEFEIKGINLFESVLAADGPTYTVIIEANFKIT